MTEPAAPVERQPAHSSARSLEHQLHEAYPEHEQAHHFAPIYTLVTNTSGTTRTTHHPQVHYIFSDDDPDLLTQALAQQQQQREQEQRRHPSASSSSSDPSGTGTNRRAILLDLTTTPSSPSGPGGEYAVSWASSLSPSWAVLDAQLSKISPPSSADGDENLSSSPSMEPRERSGGPSKPERLMLRIDGVEGPALGASASSSSERGGGGVGSGEMRLSGSGSSGHREKGDGGGEDYGALVEEFDKRMSTLRKVVEAGEERRRTLGSEVGVVEAVRGDDLDQTPAVEASAGVEQDLK